jgi:phospholipid/cholesterol/gamma-HCH transport system substrate-binding protein
MPRTRSLAWSELKIGIVGVVALVLLVTLVMAISGESGFFTSRYPLKARFTNVQGLKPGAVVRLSGKEIGTVTAVEFAGADVEVHFEVLESLRPVITTTALAQIGSLGLLGEPVVDITAGSGGAPLEDYGFVPASSSAGALADVAGSATATLEQVNTLLSDLRTGQGTLGRLITDDALFTELQAFIASAGAVTRGLQQGDGTLGRLLQDPAAYESFRGSLENLQQMTARINSGEGALGRLIADSGTGDSLSATMANLSSVTGRLSQGEGTMGRLLTEDDLYTRLNATIANLDTLTSGLSTGEGTAGQLLRDRELYENMNAAASELRALLADVRADPRKYLNVRVSIFGG